MLLSVAECQPPLCYFYPDKDQITRQTECQVQYQPEMLPSLTHT